jgi:hypothetical protein
VRSSFDRRVLPERALALVRACQAAVPSHLAGGAALSGAYLSHRLSGDIDLFCHGAGDVRLLMASLPAIAKDCGLSVRIVRDAGTLVRAQVEGLDRPLEIDLVHEALPDLASPAPSIEGVAVESLVDLRAAKLLCILSRSEPRDLVDLLFLDRAGFPPERDLGLALQKDAGIDPGVLAWLLGQFPTHPLPIMLEALTEEELVRFRDDLRERLRRIAVPGE